MSEDGKWGRRIFGLAIGATVIAAIGVAVWSLRRPPLADPDKDIANSWNESIAKLGILSLYPPQEDFHVGDVWAMAIGNANDPTPLASRAIRIGTIDLIPAIRKGLGAHPAFDDTPARTEEVGYRALPSLVPLAPTGDAGLPITMVAFPGLNISRSIRSGSGVDWGGWLGGADGTGDLVEQITIPTAATYGAPQIDVYAGYLRWCADERYRALCRDAPVRQLLSYTEPRVLSVKDGKYVFDLQLLVISRVYLMREIDHRLAASNGRSLSWAHQSSTAGTAPPAGNGGTSPPTTESSTAPTEPAGAEETTAGKDQTGGAVSIRYGDTASSSISMQSQVFQRPLVFGYRAMAFALEPSKPAGSAP